MFESELQMRTAITTEMETTHPDVVRKLSNENSWHSLAQVTGGLQVARDFQQYLEADTRSTKAVAWCILEAVQTLLSVGSRQPQGLAVCGYTRCCPVLPGAGYLWEAVGTLLGVEAWRPQYWLEVGCRRPAL